MSDFTRDEMDALYAPFPLNMHSIREGHKNRDKTKIQWFVYADRPAVQRRLDDLFPGEWEFKHIETRQTTDYVSVTAEIIIRGKARAFNGGQSPRGKDDEVDQDTEKGAFTETFRRCASMWGVGLYLYEMDYAIWTDAYTNWTEKEQRENEAKQKFVDWYNRKFGSKPEPERKQEKPATPEQSPKPQGATVSNLESTRDLICSYVELKPYTDKKSNEKKLRVVYVCADGVYASSFTRKHASDAGYVVDTWTAEGRYDLPVPAVVTVRKNGDFWDVVNVKATVADDMQAAS